MRKCIGRTRYGTKQGCVPYGNSTSSKGRDLHLLLTQKDEVRIIIRIFACYTRKFKKIPTKYTHVGTLYAFSCFDKNLMVKTQLEHHGQNHFLKAGKVPMLPVVLKLYIIVLLLIRCIFKKAHPLNLRTSPRTLRLCYPHKVLDRLGTQFTTFLLPKTTIFKLRALFAKNRNSGR